jgi:hypothetical protein
MIVTQSGETAPPALTHHFLFLWITRPYPRREKFLSRTRTLRFGRTSG